MREVQALLRGVPCLVESDDLDLGRRVVVHEYPLRDDPSPEDMGRAKQEYTLVVSVMGPDWQQQRDALRDAINEPGPCTLVHPDFGTLTITIITARMRQQMREFGKATFTLTYIQGGDASPRYPSAAADTAAAVSTAADSAATAAIEDYAATFDVVGLAAAYVDGLKTDLNRLLASVEATVGGVTNPIADMIRAPYDMGAAIVATVLDLRNLVSEPFQALGLYRALFGAATSSSFSTATPSGAQAARSQQALQNLTQRAAIAGAANTISAMKFATANDATTATQMVLDAIDEQLLTTDVVSGAPIDDDAWSSLTDLRAALVNDLRERTVQLPKLGSYTPNTTLPALVIAHLIYGDATREAELVARNAISHPGFVQGGVPLEIMTPISPRERARERG